jgi:hypothetical protein
MQNIKEIMNESNNCKKLSGSYSKISISDHLFNILNSEQLYVYCYCGFMCDPLGVFEIDFQFLSNKLKISKTKLKKSILDLVKLNLFTEKTHIKMIKNKECNVVIFLKEGV